MHYKGKVMKIKNGLLISILLPFICTWMILGKINYKNQEVTVVKSFDSKNAHITFVRINNQLYIIKQKRDKSKLTVSVIRDALAAYIAEDFKIAHSVEVISKKDKIAGKVFEDLPATLHTIAPGKMVKDVEGKYSQLCIRQRCSNIINRWFDEIIIDQITWHKDLPIIVALDIFLCNRGRHNKNLFYDEETDSFCAIDMDNIYRIDLPLYACANVEKMIKNKKKFTPQEIQALKVVQRTLQFLLKKYSPDTLIGLLHMFAQQAGYADNGSKENEDIKKKIKLYEQTIVESQISAYRFIKILDKVINN